MSQASALNLLFRSRALSKGIHRGWRSPEYARRGRDHCRSRSIGKEAKTHGEGGSLIGAALEGRRVLIVDDVITAGTAIREALAIIAAGGGVPAGIVIALDRQEAVAEAGQAIGDRRSAAQAVAAKSTIP